jgi:hypothetical protein
MQTLNDVLAGGDFELLHTVAINSNVNVNDKELRIYRYNGPLSSSKKKLSLELGFSGMEVEGELKK